MDLNPQAIRHSALVLGIREDQALKTLTLMIKEDCTVPFIARYRKEVTGNLDEVVLRNILETYQGYIELEERKTYILEVIKKMEMLTPALEKSILKAPTLTALEDLYAPYKSKRKTKAQAAREKGLQEYADGIHEKNQTWDELKKAFKPTDLVATFEEVIEGVRFILMEKVVHAPEIREGLRQLYWSRGLVVSKKKPKAEENAEHLKFRDFFEFSEPVKSIMQKKSSHRFLAMRRGMNEKILTLTIEVPEEDAIKGVINRHFIQSTHKETMFLQECGQKAYELYLSDSLDLELKTELKKIADEHAISIFCPNLRNLLLAPYLGPKTVMGVDPGVRTGCKIAIVDQTGKFLFDFVIYPHPPKEDVINSALIVENSLKHFKVEYIAIGNGTYGRETLAFFETYIDCVKDGTVKATLVSEAGASIYSASEIAREEFPDKDPTVRGSISIARRFQDPLAELVKIDAKSIGVGQYQHDVNQAKLKKSLDELVESCVNYVGVDLNTASAPLLSYVSGIGPTVAKNIVEFRDRNGAFRSRTDLLTVSRLTDKVYTQAAGFLRIYKGDCALDATFVHPERYEILRKWALDHDHTLNDIVNKKEVLSELEASSELKAKVGELTFQDIVKSLKAPSQDPRTSFKSVEFSKDIRDIKDVKAGSTYKGIVNNITQFGVFVDFGIKESGLVHISELSNNYVEDPLTVFKVGDEVQVRVLEVDMDRKRISLSCRTENAPRAERPREPREQREQRVERPAPRQEQRIERPQERTQHDTRPSPRPAPGKERRPDTNAPLKNKAFGSLKNFKV